MYVTVDQARQDGGAVGVDNPLGVIGAIGADGAEDSVLDVDTVGVQHGPREVPRAQRG